MLQKLFLICLFLVSSVILFSCEDSSTDPKDEKDDIVPQKNIEWPSLADTPWPMYRHDPQLTGRSEYIGPSQGTIKQVSFDRYKTEAGISIGYENTAYTVGVGLLAINFDGNIKWRNTQFSYSYSTPLISSDSIIYTTGYMGSILASNPVGDTLWSAKYDNTLMYNFGITIDKIGTLYFVDQKDGVSQLKAFNSKTGELIWTLKDKRIKANFGATPAISPDGNTIYLQGKNISILAIDLSLKTVKWTWGNKTLYTAPVIDNDGNLYVFSEKASYSLYSLKPDGTTNWKYDFISKKGLWSNTEPAIDFNGNIYFGIDTLYSVTNKGKFRWKKYLDGTTRYTAMICDSENSIYFGTINGERFYSFDENGEIKWVLKDLNIYLIGESPAITDDGRILLPSLDNDNVSLTIIE